MNSIVKAMCFQGILETEARTVTPSMQRSTYKNIR